MNKQKNRIMSCELAEFLGWHIGDGCISITDRYSEYTLTGDIIEEYTFYENIVLPTFNKLFQNQLNKKVELKKYKSNSVCGIYLRSEEHTSELQSH